VSSGLLSASRMIEVGIDASRCLVEVVWARRGWWFEPPPRAVGGATGVFPSVRGERGGFLSLPQGLSLERRGLERPPPQSAAWAVCRLFSCGAPEGAGIVLDGCGVWAGSGEAWRERRSASPSAPHQATTRHTAHAAHQEGAPPTPVAPTTNRGGGPNPHRVSPRPPSNPHRSWGRPRRGPTHAPYPPPFKTPRRRVVTSGGSACRRRRRRRGR
jgi:hypothetical protein